MKFDRSACIEPMYSEIPFLDRFQAAKDDGFEYVEFWSWTDKDLDAVRAAAEKAGIGISGFNGDADYSLIDPTHKEKYLEFLKQSVAAARKVGSQERYHSLECSSVTAALWSTTTPTCPTR